MKFKRLSYLLVVFIFSGFVSAGTIKLLAIGNSFSVDAIEQHLYELTEASGNDIIIGNLYIGDADLALHHQHSLTNEKAYSYRKIINGEKTIIEKYDLLSAIQDEDWDYISMQQESSKSGQFNSYFPHIFSLKNYIKKHASNPNLKYILHAIWAYAKNSDHPGFVNYANNQLTMYKEIVNATNRVYKAGSFDLLVPTGTAIQNGRESVLGDTFCRDGYHLEDTYGRFTAACTWYQALFKKSVKKNPYIPETITEDQARIAKCSAHKAVKKPRRIAKVPCK